MCTHSYVPVSSLQACCLTTVPNVTIDLRSVSRIHITALAPGLVGFSGSCYTWCAYMPTLCTMYYYLI